MTAMSKRYPMPLPYGWFGVAYADEINAGESKPLRAFGKELVLFRAEDGKPAVLDAYCPHLGAHLGYGINAEAGGGGRIVGDTIVCPFHAWRFDANGVCVEVPYAKNIPPKVQGKQCLTSYPTVEKNGAIWSWYHPQNVAPMWEVAEFEEMNDPTWGISRKVDWIIKTHAQEMAENAADPAHFKYVHGTASIPEWSTTYDGPQARGLQCANLQTPRGEVKSEIHTANSGPGQAWTRFRGIAETFLMSMVTPIDDEYVQIRFCFAQPLKDGKIPERGVEAAIIADIVKQLNEDKPIWENKIFRAQPTLCDGDGPIAKFRKWYAQFYAGYDVNAA